MRKKQPKPQAFSPDAIADFQSAMRMGLRLEALAKAHCEEVLARHISRIRLAHPGKIVALDVAQGAVFPEAYALLNEADMPRPGGPQRRRVIPRQARRSPSGRSSKLGPPNKPRRRPRAR